MAVAFRISGENKSVFGDEHFDTGVRFVSNRHGFEITPNEKTKERLISQMKHRFKCLDDDGVVYFWGACSDDSSFAPLDAVGQNYGCTEIQYRNEETGEYETL